MNELNDLENKFQKIHNDINRNLPKGMIYHYTSFDGLKNIVKERKLRHTDYRFFNDPTELQYGQNIILKALSKSNIDYNLIDRTRELFNNFDRLWYLYIACFSTKIEKLSLWRYYASNGTGFAIGFNENFHKVENTSDPTGKVCISNVIYGEDESIRLVNRFIEIYLERDHEKYFSHLMAHLTACLPSFKDSSFQDEHEIRLFYSEGEMISSTDQPFFFEDQYRDFIPIQESHFPFVNHVQGKKPIVAPDKFCDADISEIWVGPSCEFLEAKKCIKILLKEEGYDVKNIEIRESLLPFRGI